MPAPVSSRQPAPALAWFDGPPGRAVLDSERDVVEEALREWPGRPWMWLAPCAVETPKGAGFGLKLAARGEGWHGPLQCGGLLPLADESIGAILLQHAGDLGGDPRPLLAESARVLEPRGRLWLLALNPFTPYRRHWAGSGVDCAEPVTWRRRLRAAGLVPEPVSAGLGPRWKPEAAAQRQHGAGLRAAYLLRAEKRIAAPVPPDPVPALGWQPGLPA
jgi:SAM-dependent methyltransferase